MGELGGDDESEDEDEKQKKSKVEKIGDGKQQKAGCSTVFIIFSH